MVFKNGLLEVNKDELIEIIKSNPDNSDLLSVKMNGSILEMIERSFDNLSLNQSNWILKKVHFIFRKLNKGKVKDIKFVIKPKTILLRRKVNG